MAIPLLVLLLAVATVTVLLLGWRLRSLHARGVLLRWGIRRAPQRGFASRRDVREHLGSGAGRGHPTAVGEEITERGSAP